MFTIFHFYMPASRTHAFQNLLRWYLTSLPQRSRTSFSFCTCAIFSCNLLTSNSCLSARLVSSDTFECNSWTCFLYASSCAFMELAFFSSCQPPPKNTSKSINKGTPIAYITSLINGYKIFRELMFFQYFK